MQQDLLAKDRIARTRSYHRVYHIMAVSHTSRCDITQSHRDERVMSPRGCLARIRHSMQWLFSCSASDHATRVRRSVRARAPCAAEPARTRRGLLASASARPRAHRRICGRQIDGDARTEIWRREYGGGDTEAGIRRRRWRYRGGDIGDSVRGIVPPAIRIAASTPAVSLSLRPSLLPSLPPSLSL